MKDFNISCTRDSTDLKLPNIGCFIFGEPADDRGTASTLYGQSISTKSFQLSYSPDQLAYKLNNSAYSIDDIDPIVDLFNTKSVLIDATTLGFVEIHLCIRASLESINPSISIIYVEPHEYKNSRSRGVLNKRDFSLSDRTQNFSGLPGSLIHINDQYESKAVIIVGYEGDRLQRFLEQHPLPSVNCSIIYGVPAFYPGWEANAFSNTVKILYDQRINSVLFAGATNPLGAYEAIRQIHSSMEHKEDGLIVVPIGTKPQGIGAAIYACENSGVGIAYDHPNKTKGRSDGVGVWHLYQVSLQAG